MTELTERIRNLTPEQQELLRRRLREKNLEPSPAAAPQETDGAPQPSAGSSARRRRSDFSIFFFSADGTAENDRRYELLLECVRLADRHGFTAVWTPERHFQAFGGLYPNPSVLSAALAMITENVQIRAGSLVLPLHSPVRVAEDWALVDNLSGGRVAISFATGWHEHDYVIAPGNYEERRELMFENIGVVRRLWAGEDVELPGVGGKATKVRTLPRPIQAELPFWVTASSPRTWRRAGEIGANVLTALISGTVDDLRQQVAAYRRARLENGHDPRKGIVSVMLHTFLDDDLESAREKVREPMYRYLSNFLDQFRPLVEGGLAAESSSEMQSLLDLAFERYFEHSSLLGTAEKCAALVESVTDAGADDIACLVDFGLDLENTLSSLERLAEMRRRMVDEAAE